MPVFRPFPIDADQAEYMREVVRKSRELVNEPAPDTFLGRKTQEPFPTEDDPMTREDIQNLLHSELQPPAE
ncbi:hypothetical protein [Bradyrhizobium sp. CCBAU 53380]|uniref:hypothetical protein n=1 Tax=Bradyrhizobium sp. CCBAU 53380 TaxID=1325117 RepID=UPI002303AD8C|nr:hypothetical protein [Bradyrhizobium sp. CCBAU 53380]MDA9421647.1 hypothetical protein [Bradyrhizobium sp. CCBAU 53380]